MTAISTAISALLTGLSVHEIECADDSPTYPYVVLSGLADNRMGDILTAAKADIHDYLHVTHTGLTADSINVVRTSTRSKLDGAKPTVTGWRVRLRRFDATDIMPDEDVTIPGVGHVLYQVDSYTVDATPQS
ncbi:MAG: hypothetical protein M0R06_02140 [Sphaerochaeta sp.]|jgi:hypothetical protein|nr:hypothetical protein [Sphaerochaeta sp.]